MEKKGPKMNKKRYCTQKPDPAYEEYCQLFREFEALSLYFVNTEFIPVQDRVPYFPEDLQAFYIQKWNELEIVIEELSNCKYVHYRSDRTTTRVDVTYINKNTGNTIVLVEGEHSPLPAKDFEVVQRKTELVFHPLTKKDFQKKLYATLYEK